MHPVLFAAQTSALLLSLAGSLVDEQPPSAVALDLSVPVEELEWVHPELVARGVAVDLAPIPASDQAQGREALCELLRSAWTWPPGCCATRASRWTSPA